MAVTAYVFCHHGLYHIHYINLDVCCHFLLMDTYHFRPHAVLYLILNKVIPRGWLCLHTKFSFPYLFPFYLHWFWIILWLIWHWPHFQHAPWLRAVPYVGCLWVSITWSLCKFPQTGPLVGFFWKIGNHVICATLCDWHVVDFNPVLHKEITYINVPRFPSAWLLSIFFIFIAHWLSCNNMFCLMSYTCNPMNKQI